MNELNTEKALMSQQIKRMGTGDPLADHFELVPEEPTESLVLDSVTDGFRTTYESEIDLTELFEKQLELTNFTRKTNGIHTPDMDKQMGAVICELWESANELKSEGFKDWTKKTRTEHTLEEVVDVLHFYLQIGNDIMVPNRHFHVETRTSIVKQYLALTSTLLAVDGVLMWSVSFAQYRGLVKMLGYDWEDDILPAYEKKYRENFERQKRGY